MAAATALLAGILTAAPLMGRAESGDERWHQQLSDDELVEVVEEELEHLPATFVRGLEDYPEKVQKRVRSTPVRV